MGPNFISTKNTKMDNFESPQAFPLLIIEFAVEVTPTPMWLVGSITYQILKKLVSYQIKPVKKLLFQSFKTTWNLWVSSLKGYT